ncbi:MAG: hypothetical protein GX604_00240 [Actinobacteria bacterium]|nr:hypothetical protein [Actinomycetota bacterium]
MDKSERWAAVGRIGAFIGGLALMAVIFIIDIKTSIWQDLVVLAGLAGSLVTFLLTFLVVNRVVGRLTERRWAPVTRVALTDLLHGLADEGRSELSRGIVVSRSLPVPGGDDGEAASAEELADLLHRLVGERRLLTERLGVWAGFLASSGNNDEIMRQVANTSLQLDRVRDAVLAIGGQESTEAMTALRAEVVCCNENLDALAAEIEHRLREHANEAVGQ